MNERIKRILNKDVIHNVESIVYILSIIVVVIANVYGPIEIRMIPLLFILGIVGNIVFKRPVITSVFGFIDSLCTVYSSGISNILENFLTSIIFSVYIGLGEIFGSIIVKVYNDYIKKKKDEKTKKDFKINLAICVLLVIICSFVHSFTDSNIFLYNSAKTRLFSYLENNYPQDKFKIMYSSYCFRGKNHFKINVKNIEDDNVYKFIVYVDKKMQIYDGIKDSKDEEIVSSLKRKLEKRLDNEQIDLKYDINISDEGNELSITRNVQNVDKNKIYEFSKDVSKVLDKVLEDNNEFNFEQVNLSLIDTEESSNSHISTVFVEGYITNKKEGIQSSTNYIIKALSIEYID